MDASRKGHDTRKETLETEGQQSSSLDGGNVLEDSSAPDKRLVQIRARLWRATQKCKSLSLYRPSIDQLRTCVRWIISPPAEVAVALIQLLRVRESPGPARGGGRERVVAKGT